MTRFLCVSALALAACDTGVEAHVHVNEAYAFEVDLPSPFDVEPIVDDDGTALSRPGVRDCYALHLPGAAKGPRMRVGVNCYEIEPRPLTIYVYYDYAVGPDGALVRLGRRVDVPEHGYRAARAMTLFFDAERDDVHSFAMDLRHEDHEALFVGIVESFRATE